MTRKLLRGGTILTGDPALGELRRGDLLIEDTRIAAVAPHIAADDAELIDAAGMLVLPGFIDTHRHTWQALLRSAGTDWTLSQYYTGVRLIMGRLYTPADMYDANYIGALECLDAGITTLYDWSHNNNTPDHADEAIRALRDVGLRAVFGYGNASDEWIPPSKLPTNLADLTRVRQQHFAADDGLLTLAFAARGPQFASLDLTEDEFLHARRLGIRITVHVGEGVWGLTKPIVQLASRNLLAADTTYVHCNTLGADDLRLLVDSGGTTSVSPDSELNMGMGSLPVLRLMALGNRPSISCDIVTSVPGDMFSAMRSLLTGVRTAEGLKALDSGKEPDWVPLTTKDVFEFATIEGARACGLEHRIGSLAVGKQADIVMLDADAPNLVPLNYSYGAVVEAAHPGNIHSVFVAGRAVKRDGKLLGIDLRALRRRTEAARDGLFARAGISQEQSWMPKPYLKEDADAEF